MCGEGARTRGWRPGAAQAHALHCKGSGGSARIALAVLEVAVDPRARRQWRTAPTRIHRLEEQRRPEATTAVPIVCVCDPFPQQCLHA
jgi:hypothetical protein